MKKRYKAQKLFKGLLRQRIIRAMHCTEPSSFFLFLFFIFIFLSFFFSFLFFLFLFFFFDNMRKFLLTQNYEEIPNVGEILNIWKNNIQTDRKSTRLNSSHTDI